MDKKPNEIHKNLNPTKIKQSYHTYIANSCITKRITDIATL